MRSRRAWRTVIVCLIAAVAAASCGAPPPTGDRLVFDEAFDGSSLNRDRWSTCHWWDPDKCTIASNDELEWYLPTQVQVRDNRLLLTANHSQAVDRGKYPYVSGMVTTGPQEQHGRAKFAFTYGRVEVTLQMPSGRGLWPAVWMLPASTSSRPEIDLVEAVGDRPDEWIFHLHPKNRSRSSHSSRIARPELAQGVHTLAVDWQPGQLRWFVDGEQVWKVEGPDVPAEPMYLVANLAVGGEYPGPPSPSTRFPATFVIERVRVWQ